jgi:hypothetical protein
VPPSRRPAARASFAAVPPPRGYCSSKSAVANFIVAAFSRTVRTVFVSKPSLRLASMSIETLAALQPLDRFGAREVPKPCVHRVAGEVSVGRNDPTLPVRREGSSP